jgi:hypothetical protein
VDLVVGNAEWPSGGLARRCRIGASGAQLSRIAVHREAGSTKIQGQPSTTTKLNN